MARSGGSGPIRLRLALAFIGVALLAVGLMAGLTAMFAAADVSSLAAQQRQELTQAITVAAGASWETQSGWSTSDLATLIGAGNSIGADIQVSDNAGRIVARSPGGHYSRAPDQPRPSRGGQRLEFCAAAGDRQRSWPGRAPGPGIRAAGRP